MASPTQWAWVWVDFGSWWWTGRPGMLWFMGSQRVRHDWVTELNWTELMELLMGSRMRKEYNRVVCCHSVCLTYMLSISWEKSGWMSLSGIKIGGRNMKNLRYVDDTTLMAESEEELKSLLMRVKEKCERVSLKLNIKKTKIMVSGPITSWQTEGEKVKVVTGFLCGWCSHEIRGDCFLTGKLGQT